MRSFSTPSDELEAFVAAYGRFLQSQGEEPVSCTRVESVDEPAMKPGMAKLDNVIVLPHLGSATSWTRRGMAGLAACNVAGILMGYPVWGNDHVRHFLEGTPPKAAPSIVNAADLKPPSSPA